MESIRTRDTRKQTEIINTECDIIIISNLCEDNSQRLLFYTLIYSNYRLAEPPQYWPADTARGLSLGINDKAMNTLREQNCSKAKEKRKNE